MATDRHVIGTTVIDFTRRLISSPFTCRREGSLAASGMKTVSPLTIARLSSGTRAPSSACRLIAMRIGLLSAVISIALCAESASQTASTVAGSGAPIGAYTVVPELPGMGRPVDITATAARRRALMRRIGRGAVLIPAGHERNVETDYIQDNDFRQDNTFYYFTELETQDAFLLMTARGPDSIETVLFLPPRTPSQERWTG